MDFETQNLLLQDRTIPLEPSVADCLQKRYEKYRTVSDRVLIADRGKKPMTPENVSRLAKNALDSEGQKVSLMDLRHDWLLRQIEAHGWAYAAKVSGLAVSSLRGQFGSCLKGKQDQNFAVSGGKDEVEYLLWRIVQQEGNSTAGLAIWMCWQLAMQPGEVAALTWDQVDFKTGHIHLPNRDIDMGTRSSGFWEEVWDRQKPLNERRCLWPPPRGIH